MLQIGRREHCCQRLERRQITDIAVQDRGGRLVLDLWLLEAHDFAGLADHPCEQERHRLTIDIRFRRNRLHPLPIRVCHCNTATLDRAEHTGFDLEIQVPAGRFEDCIEITETSPLEPDRESVKVYCPHVGLVADGELKLMAVYDPNDD